jgi:hypothetical protein
LLLRSAQTLWHGYVPENKLPNNYFLHGTNNLPVACSTPQSSIYALAGKLHAFQSSIFEQNIYRGDVHIEPHHGTNVTGCMTLTETAKWVAQLCPA